MPGQTENLSTLMSRSFDVVPSSASSVLLVPPTLLPALPEPPDPASMLERSAAIRAARFRQDESMAAIFFLRRASFFAFVKPSFSRLSSVFT